MAVTARVTAAANEDEKNVDAAGPRHCKMRRKALSSMQSKEIEMAIGTLSGAKIK